MPLPGRNHFAGVFDSAAAVSRCLAESNENEISDRCRRRAALLVEVIEKGSTAAASGYLKPTIRSEMLKAGVIEAIQKPYDFHDLLAKIRSIIGPQPVADDHPELF
jgi:hypothetical protein